MTKIFSKLRDKNFLTVISDQLYIFSPTQEMTSRWTCDQIRIVKSPSTHPVRSKVPS